MGRKCCVPTCRTGYQSQKDNGKITLYGFPPNLEECQQWVSSLPNKLCFQKITRNMAICALHWPPDASKVPAGRWTRPTMPPSIFPSIPESYYQKKQHGCYYEVNTKSKPKENRNPNPNPIDDEIQSILESDLCSEETHDEPATPTPQVVSCDVNSSSFWNYCIDVCWQNLKQEIPLALEISQKLSELKNHTWNILAQQGYGERAGEIVDLLLTDELQTRDELAAVLDVKPPSLTVVDAAIPDGCVGMSSPDPTLQTQRSSTRKSETVKSGGLEETLSDEDTHLATRPTADTDTTHCPDLPIASPSPSHQKDRETVSVDEPPSSPHFSAEGSTSPLHSLPDVAAKDGEKEEECILCDQVFPENCDRSEHLKNCWETYSYTCSTSGLLEKHMDAHPDSFVKCTICGRTVYKSSLITHMNRHKTQRYYKNRTCLLCGELFSNETAMWAHKDTHHTKCSICDKEFNDSCGLSAHMQSNTEKRCLVCNKSFCSEGSLLLHSLSHHRSRKEELIIKKVKCSVCDKLIGQNYLRYHMEIHTGKRFKCGTCNKKFSRKFLLNVHMRSHTGEKPYLCAVCGHPFSSNCSLSRHRKIHTGEKNHPCSTCGRKFRREHNLRMHMRTHLRKR